ncbi:MAG: corrinoid protein [Chloroflexi bacterium]|nr:corrinoid protein [Chloroflexota bacterium]
MASYEELQQGVITADEGKVEDLVRQLLAAGNNPLDIIARGLTAGMAIVGQKMKTGEMFIPEVLASAHVMAKGMDILKPLVGDKLSSIYIGKVVFGTVQGDIHNIGKKIVSMLLESGGFVVIDIGVDVPAAKFIEAVKREQPDILALSALLTTTIPRMKEVIQALSSANLRDRVRVMVGGAPVTQSFADSIGADGYAPDAVLALERAKQLLD